MKSEDSNANHISKIDRRRFLELIPAAAAGNVAARAQQRSEAETVYLVTNMHGDSLGWLAPYYVERNYGLYNYVDHLDLTLRDPNYKFVMSEIPHVITMMEYEPQKFEQLKAQIKQGRAEIPNALATEATVNLSGGEALVMQIVEGLRWYRQAMNIRPRYAYCIDITGWHEQMAQIVAGTELDAFVYCRYNPTVEKPEDPEMFRGGYPVHWIESPDGTRALAVTPGHYTGGFRTLMIPSQALPPEKVIAEITGNINSIKKKWQYFPPGTPRLSFAGQADYSPAFNYKGYPKEMLDIWNATNPDVKLKFATFSEWFDAIKPAIDAGKYKMPVVKTGSKAYGFNSFWVLAPRMKQWFRRSEHVCQASEGLATIASLAGKFDYPSQDLGNAWFLVSMNLDRGPLWGICVGGIFEHPKSWDISDRFKLIDKIAADTSAKALPSVIGKGSNTLGFYNPVNWERDELFELTLPAGKTVKNTVAQLLEEGKTAVFKAKLPSMGVRSLQLEAGAPAQAKEVTLPEAIETNYYTAKVDSETGALVSLKLKPSGREMLKGPANVLLAQVHVPEVKPQKPQRHEAWAAHFLLDRTKRKTLATSSDKQSMIKVQAGPLATVVEVTSPFHGGDVRRTMRFYKDSPRIDFVTETKDLPHETIVMADFPLAGEVTELRRGIPYGFAQTKWAELKPEERGNHTGALPVIRWSHYMLSGGGGVALLDRGVPGRELNDSTATIFLHLSVARYYWDKQTDWMNGKYKQTFEYALSAHDTPWEQAGIPQLAYSYNAPPLVVPDVKAQVNESFIETSPNVIIEALRRVGGEIELRFAETKGAAGTAVVKVKLPHESAALTNMIGNKPTALKAAASAKNAKEYRFELRPQQIVTMRLKAKDVVAEPKSVSTFDPLIPEAKRAYTRSYKHPEFKAYPPREESELWKWKPEK